MMFSLFRLLFSLHFGAIPAYGGDTVVSFRAEARAAARDSESRPAALIHSPSWSAAPQVPGFSILDASGPVLGPVTPYLYRPEDWVRAVADRLNVQSRPLVKAAMFVAAIPLELDVRPPNRVYARFTLRGF
jgi:hypothetical protein